MSQADNSPLTTLWCKTALLHNLFKSSAEKQSHHRADFNVPCERECLILTPQALIANNTRQDKNKKGFL